MVGYGPDMFGYAYALGDFIVERTVAARHGHNFVVHTAVELGLLGLLAYASLVLTLGWSLLRMLRAARRREIPPWVGYLAIGLNSVLVGRMIEQMAGKAQISDWALTWILAAMIFALAVSHVDRPAPQEDLPASSDEDGSGMGQRKRRLARQAARPSRRSNAAFNPLRVTGAVIIAVIALGFWSQAVLSNIRSAFTEADALAASSAGRPTDAFLLLQRSVEQAPGWARARLYLGAALRNSARVETEDALQVRVLELAYEEAVAVIDRNPLDERAWSLAAEISGDLAVLDPAFKDQAIEDNLTLVALVPNRWRARLQLAWAYHRLGDQDRALDAITTARALGAADDMFAGFFYYTEARVLRALGRTEEADAVIERLGGYSDAGAQALFRELVGGTAG